MKIFFITEGGKDTGFGHLMRCKAIYQALEEMGEMPEIIVNGDESIRDLLKDGRYKLLDWLNDKRSLFAMIEGADIAIVDSYLADPDFYSDISKVTKNSVFIDDNNRINYPAGVVINGNIYSEKLSYPKREAVTYLLGSRYFPLRKEFWNVPDKIVNERIRKVMVTFGGGDSKNMTCIMMDLLNKEFPALEKRVIVSRSVKDIREIGKNKEQGTSLFFGLDAKGMKDVMLESDIAISSGGQILYEFARVGLPVIAVAVAENQLNNVSCWQTQGFIEYAGWWQDADITKKVKERLSVLWPRGVRVEKCNKGREAIDGLGAKRLVSELFRYYDKN